jgi:hypothetical protein
MSLLEHRTVNPRGTIDSATVMILGRELAEWRLGGCPGSGFGELMTARVKKAARSFRVSYSELWANVHKTAYEIIDADPRSNLAATKR